MKKGKVGIKVRNGDVDRALRIFKKMVMESGHLEELFERQHFVKPSIAKREYKKKLRQKHLIDKKNDNWAR
jgi:ribosomal protein S21